MSNYFKQILAGALAVSTLSGCNLGVDRDATETGEGYYYEGYVYDGVSNERLTDLEISVSQRGATITGQVDDQGHFLVGPVKPDHDYTVTIEAEDYREFFAVQSGPSSLPSSVDNQETFYYEAFLFPESILSPEVTLSFFTPDGNGARPTGSLRLTPTVATAQSAIHLDGNTTQGSVPGQVWSNDADRRERTVMFDVEEGEVVVEEGALVYGVSYTGTIFGTDGYAYENFFYTSGLEGDRTVSLNRLDPTSLALTANSLDISNISENAEVVLTFNHPIEFNSDFPAAEISEMIDDGFTINSPDYDTDGDRNVLVSNIGDDPADNDRGTSVSIDGNTLTLSWARDASNFDDEDDGDPIVSATYSDLNQITLRLAGGRVDQEVNLASLLGSSSLTVLVDGANAENPPPPLALTNTVIDNSDMTQPSVTYTFNRAVTYVSLADQGTSQETIDDSFTQSSTDDNAPFTPSAFPTDASPFAQERGTSIVVSGTTVTLSWDNSVMSDPLDTVNSVIFGGFFFVPLRPAGSTTENTTLGTLVGAGSQTILAP